MNSNLLKTSTWLLSFFIFLYLLPDIFAAFFCFVFIYSVYKSNSDYIHLVVVFIILSNPGGLFISKTETIIPLLGNGISLTELFSLTLIFKYNIIYKKSTVLLKSAYRIYFFYLIFLIIIGLLSGMRLEVTEGTGYGPYIRTLRLIIIIPLYITIPKRGK